MGPRQPKPLTRILSALMLVDALTGLAVGVLAYLAHQSTLLGHPDGSEPFTNAMSRVVLVVGAMNVAGVSWMLLTFWFTGSTRGRWLFDRLSSRTK